MNLMDRIADSAGRNMRAYVAEPQRLRRMFRLDVLTVIFLFALTIVEDFTDEEDSSLLMSVGIGALIGGFIGVSMLSRMKRARAYSQGWIEGRLAAYQALQEADRRGLSGAEWLEAEMEKDQFTMRWML
jgi:hypothetical protein